MADYAAAGEEPDADGLPLDDLRLGNLGPYTTSLCVNDGTRYGVDPLRPSVWWYLTGPKGDHDYLGRMAIRHEPVNDILGEAGSQLWISVRPSMRRLGVGTAMLTAAIPLARANGVPHPRIEVRCNNTAAQHFLEHLGAERVRVPRAARAGRIRYVLPEAP
ncbi:GNAT family N-acetyltransferase [Actinomadura atramentaria]|uniref:GNAT family N-acetyltransferase n=1 Tax=Actinomadura atramentaria TaxID=1990 RepID=UPI0003A623FE|nr:GNAT family N-acetyltransferase [Actinomadura atramentaria]